MGAHGTPRFQGLEGSWWVAEGELILIIQLMYVDVDSLRCSIPRLLESSMIGGTQWKTSTGILVDQMLEHQQILGGCLMALLTT